MNEELEKGNELLSEYEKRLERVRNESAQNLRVTRDINDEIRESLKLVQKESDFKKSVRQSLTAINKVAQANFEIAKIDNKLIRDKAGILKKQNDLAKIQTSVANEILTTEKKIEQLAYEKLTSDEKTKAELDKQIQSYERVLKGLGEAVIQSDEYSKNLKTAKDAADEFSKIKSPKFFSALSDAANSIPGLKKLSGPFKSAAEKSAEVAADMIKIDEKTGKVQKLNFFQRSAAGLKGLNAGVGELLKGFGGFALVGTLVNGMLKADKSAQAIAQGLNESYDAANLTSKSIIKIKNNSDDALITYNGLKHALLDINEELGTSAMISGETLKTFDKLHKTAGLTSEQLMGIGKISFATGKDLRGQTDQFLKQVKTTKDQYKVSLNSKQILTEISKTSAATQLSLGLSVEELAKAATTAKAFGMNLSQVEGIAGSLLNFESSIEKELEAELLLGKNINLEKARQAALNNDLATVAEEIAKQAGTAAEFSKMNRLQQEAIAGAVGMSREDLAQTLFTQEQLAGLSEQDAKERKKILDYAIEKYGVEEANRMLEEDGIATLEAQASEQAKMAAAAERMNETFMELGKNLLPILDGMSKLVGFAAKNVELIMGGVAAYKVYQGYQKISAALAAKDAAKGLAAYAINAAKSVASIPFIGPALAIGAGIAAFAAGKALIGKSDAEAKADDMISGPVGSSGYGGRILTGPEGSIALNNKDTIVAGTNLDQGGGNTNVNIDMTETNTLLRQILSKQGTVSLDAEKMGTAISMNTYEISP